MRSGRTSRAFLSVAIAVSAVLLASLARADEASGTWTGYVDLRGNYYWETSTRVVAPEVRAQLNSPGGVRIEADYLVDAVTSASVASGVQEDIRFTEIRNQGMLSLSREFDLGEAQLRIGAMGRLSHEPDYFATAISSFATLSLNQRTTVLSAALTYVHDDVGAVIRGGETRVDPTTGRDLSDRGRQGQLEAFTSVLTWNQVLSPVCTLVTSYQLVRDWGYLQNPYRRARVDGGLQPETHPNERTRHTLYGHLAYFITQTSTAIHLAYRAYVDDWNVASLTPEVRIYQMLGRDALVRLRYRYYDQTQSFFYSPSGYTSEDSYFTADNKMSPFDSHMFGVQLRVGLGFLSNTPLSFLNQAWLDMSFNYWFQTSGYGNGVLAQTGLRTAF